jgi:uncharacterized protein YjbJ (UPF0337 family)
MTVSQQVLSGSWKEIKGKLRERWGQLTDDDLEEKHGNVEQLIGAIERRTGESADSIREYLDEVSDKAASFVEKTSASVRQYGRAAMDTAGESAKQVSDTMRDATGQAMEHARAGYRQAEDLVRERPWESLGVCFGAGVIAGLFVGLALRSR